MSGSDVFWGKAGAGIMFMCAEDKTVMLVKRSAGVMEPGTWGITGGSCKGEGHWSGEEGEAVSEEEAWMCAGRETLEELRYFPKKLEIVSKVVYRKKSFSYTTFIVNITAHEKEKMSGKIVLNWENDEFRWFDLSTVADQPDLHYGAQYVFDTLKKS